MDAITSALSAIQPELKVGTEVAGLGSTAYNLYNQYQNQQYQNNLRSYAQDPAKMNAYAAQFTQPLNAGLTTGVANQAQAYLAQRGLSDSPQISEQVEAQAIAPWIQQNQQQGYQDALKALSLGGGAIPPQLQQQNSLSALAKAFSLLPGLKNQLNPAQFAELMRAGTVQPTQLDTGIYATDYAPGGYAGTGGGGTGNAGLDTSVWTPDYAPGGYAGTGGGGTGNAGLDTSVWTPDYSADLVAGS